MCPNCVRIDGRVFLTSLGQWQYATVCDVQQLAVNLPLRTSSLALLRNRSFGRKLQNRICGALNRQFVCTEDIKVKTCSKKIHDDYMKFIYLTCDVF